MQRIISQSVRRRRLRGILIAAGERRMDGLSGTRPGVPLQQRAGRNARCGLDLPAQRGQMHICLSAQQIQLSRSPRGIDGGTGLPQRIDPRRLRTGTPSTDDSSTGHSNAMRAQPRGIGITSIFLPQNRDSTADVDCNPSSTDRARVVHGDCAVAERRRRDQFKPSCAWQPALIKSGAVTGDPGMDEKLVLVYQIQPVQLGRKLAASEKHACRRRILEFPHTRAQVAGDVVTVGSREVRSRQQVQQRYREIDRAR